MINWSFCVSWHVTDTDTSFSNFCSFKSETFTVFGLVWRYVNENNEDRWIRRAAKAAFLVLDFSWWEVSNFLGSGVTALIPNREKLCLKFAVCFHWELYGFFIIQGKVLCDTTTSRNLLHENLFLKVVCFLTTVCIYYW